jgi:hypothetical protein
MQRTFESIGTGFLNVIVASFVVGSLCCFAQVRSDDQAEMLSSPSPGISGSIAKDTTWQGSVFIDGPTTVNVGVTVTILPGTKVQFKHYRGYREPEKRLSLLVYGALVAEGTPQHLIYFTSDAPDPQNGDWSMVRLFSSSLQSLFRYVVFECGKQGLNVWNEDPLISHCTFRWNNWEGIYFESYCTGSLDTCLMVQNGYNGLAAEQFNTLTLRYCEVDSNGTSGIHSDASALTVQDSRILKNGAHGLSVDDNGSMTALGDLIANNGGWGIGVGQGSNTVTTGSLSISGNKSGAVQGSYSVVYYPFDPPPSISLGFAPDSSYALGYTPSDPLLDRYEYVYPDDETRQVLAKIGKGLGLTWSVAWDGANIWTATLSGKIYQLNPVTGTVVKQFSAPGSQPWGMTFDGRSLWLVDFAEKRISKIDTADGTELKTFSTPDPLGGCKGVAWDGRYLNIMGWTSSVIYRVDTNGTVAGTISLQQGGRGGIAWDGRNFWVPGGKILKYDTLGTAVGWIYPCSEGTWDMAWDGTYLWMSQRTNENWSDAKLYQVEILDDHSPAITLYVKLQGNDHMDGLNGASAKAHLQAAIDAAPSKAVVRIAEGAYGENISLLNKNITLEGGYDSVTWSKDVNLHPVILTGGGRGPVVRIASGTTAIVDVVLRDGLAGEQGGGGLDITGGITHLTGCLITQNSAVGQHGWGGGALTVLDGVLSLSDCRVVDNASPGGAGGLRIGAGTKLSVFRTLIAGNSGSPAIHIDDASGVFVNCTVADNSAGAFLFSTSSQGNSLVNSILWGNGTSDIEGYAPVVQYSDVQRGFEGSGNIASDPLFLDPQRGDYRLRSASPCIDAGDAGFPLDQDGTRADMGAYSFDHNIAAEIPAGADVRSTFSLGQNYPNPFNPTTTIRYFVPHRLHVELLIYNTLGQKVQELVNSEVDAGDHVTVFDASGLASGVYFYRMQTNEFVHVRSLVLLK